MDSPEPKKIFQLCVHAVQKSRSTMAEVLARGGSDDISDEALSKQFPDEWIFTEQCRDVSLGWDGVSNPLLIDAHNALMFVRMRGGSALNSQLLMDMTEAGYAEYFDDPSLLIHAA